MTRTYLLGLALLTLAACAAPLEEAVVVLTEPVLEEPVLPAPDPLGKTYDPCAEVGDDGIGGTGCAVD